MISFNENWMTSNLLLKYFGYASIDLWDILETLMNQTITQEDTDSYLGGLFGMYDYYGDSESDNGECKSEDCQKVLLVVKKYLNILSECLGVKPRLPFGSLLSTLLPANSFYGIVNEVNNEFPFNSFAVSDFKGAKWEHQGPIHDYFANLSLAFGFSANENVSLYDLPQIMASPNLDRYNGSHKLYADRSFWYTRRRYFGIGSGEDQKKCKIHWLNFIFKRYTITTLLETALK